ncbi:MAG: hypothetical protein MZV64_60280 [Ignavibacteriales bacterium]|nr:hypothetical protein [Ignavibacteriales bacterium]
MFDMGLIDRIPKLAIIQAEGCSPMVNAFKAGKDVAEPVIPDTRIIILSTGDPGKIVHLSLESITQSIWRHDGIRDGCRSLCRHALARQERRNGCRAGNRGRLRRSRKTDQQRDDRAGRERCRQLHRSHLPGRKACARRPVGCGRAPERGPVPCAARRSAGRARKPGRERPPPFCWWMTTQTMPC